MNRSIRHGLWIVAAALLLVLVPACSPTNDGDAVVPSGPPNVVLIVMDTVRADHVGCYGYERATSPQVDAFAESATRYTRALSSASWTVPSHASMFTGVPPLAHGAHTFPAAHEGPKVNSLGEHWLTLAEALSDKGYRTGAFVANAGFLSPKWRLDQGFETYHVERVYAEELNPRVFDWLDEIESPFFLFVNYIDAHRPYNVKPRPGFIDAEVPSGVEDLNRLIEQVLPATGPVDPELARKVIDQYDTAIANLDEQVGALLERLDRDGADRDTVIVITSDHGEYFGEHHLVEHSKDIYQEGIRIPLIVRGAGQGRGGTDDTLVVSHDLPGIVLAEFPDELGQSLSAHFPHTPGSHLVISENYYTRTKDLDHPVWGSRFRRVRQAVFEWPYKLIYSSDGQHELYDLEQDPREQHNLLEERPEVVARLLAGLRELEKGRAVLPDGPDLPPLDDDLRKRLEELGYVEKQEP